MPFSYGVQHLAHDGEYATEPPSDNSSAVSHPLQGAFEVLSRVLHLGTSRSCASSMVFSLLRVGLMRSDPLAELFKALSTIDAVEDGPELQYGRAVRRAATVVPEKVTGLARAR